VNDTLPQLDRPCPGAALYLGDCREVLPALPSGSFDLCFTDPPYPEISRSYGRWTEAGWWDLMRAVVPECMRVLKSSGSAVFVLQPNSERVGRMRTWHLEFELWVAKAWGVVQNAYWWNTAAMPGNYGGLMRPSVKPCVWFGPAGCWRDQGAVLWDGAGMNATVERCHQARSAGRETSASGRGVHRQRVWEASRRRGGVTPFNLIPTTHGQGASAEVAGSYGHGAGTPRLLCDFWVRYLCPPGGSVLDPFSGTATTGLAALKYGCDYVGIEQVPEYHATACRRLAEAAGPLFATPAAVPPG
jgi:DNA modification methylase